MPSKYNCLLLDVDGTLLDFAAAEREAITETLQAHDLPCGEEQIALYSQINAALWLKHEKGEIKKDALTRQRFSQLCEALGEKRDVIRMNNDYMTRLTTTVHVIPGAEEFLAEMAEFATLAAVSNGVHRSLLARLEKSGLMQYFDGVFSSDKMGASKPSPRCFDIPLRQLGIDKKAARVLVVGDSLTADIKGGQNAKLDTCWFNPQGMENTTNITPLYTVRSYAELKHIAVGEEELKRAENREKRHQV